MRYTDRDAPAVPCASVSQVRAGPARHSMSSTEKALIQRLGYTSGPLERQERFGFGECLPGLSGSQRRPEMKALGGAGRGELMGGVVAARRTNRQGQAPHQKPLCVAPALDLRQPRSHQRHPG
jgi:hypothetical protein